MRDRLVCEEIGLVSWGAVCSVHPILGRANHRLKLSLSERQIHGEPLYGEREIAVVGYRHLKALPQNLQFLRNSSFSCRGWPQRICESTPY